METGSSWCHGLNKHLNNWIYYLMLYFSNCLGKISVILQMVHVSYQSIRLGLTATCHNSNNLCAQPLPFAIEDNSDITVPLPLMACSR